MREGRWAPWHPSHMLGGDLAGQTLGIVGWGRIGQAMARRGEGFGMKIVHSSRSSGIPLEELLEQADYVSVHTPLTPETRHLIGAAELQRMKPTAYLINTSRGGTVDQVALREALEAGEIAGAGLDVTDPEPLPADDPLLTAPNLLVVPHVGSATVQTRSRDGRPRRRQPARRARRGGDAPPRRMTPVAAVDIGTNSTRLLIADGTRGARARVDRHAARRGRRPHRPARRGRRSRACSTCSRGSASRSATRAAPR